MASNVARPDAQSRVRFVPFAEHATATETTPQHERVGVYALSCAVCVRVCVSVCMYMYLTAEHHDLGQLDRIGADRVEHILQLVDDRNERLHGVCVKAPTEHKTRSVLHRTAPPQPPEGN